MINKKGLEAFSLRGLARDQSCQAASLYEYFESRADVLSALNALASEELLERLQLACADADSDGASVKHMLSAYIEFFTEAKWRLEVIYSVLPTRRATIDDELPENSPYRFFVDRIRALARSQTLDDARAEEWAFAAWSYAHGVVVLRMGFLNPLDVALKTYTDAGINTFLTGMVGAGDGRKRKSR